MTVLTISSGDHVQDVWRWTIPILCIIKYPIAPNVNQQVDSQKQSQKIDLQLGSKELTSEVGYVMHEMVTSLLSPFVYLNVLLIGLVAKLISTQYA